MKTLKTILQEVISGIKAWVDANVVHKSGTETIDGNKTFSGGIYSSNYYYNGTAWGLDKANVWTGRNLFYGANTTAFKATNTDLLPKTQTYPTSTQYYFAQRYYAYNDENLGLDRSACYTTGENVRTWYVYSYDTGAYKFFRLKINANASDSEFIVNTNKVIPESNNATDLGTSTNKWKTLNGVNPGALSLPSISANSATGNNPPNGYVNLDTTNWDLTGKFGADANFYTPPLNGWLSVIVQGTENTNWVEAGINNHLLQSAQVDSRGYASMCVPCLAGVQCKISIKATSIFLARFYPAQGSI